MCGSIKVKGYRELVGNLADNYLGQGWGRHGDKFPIIGQDGKIVPAEFNGHARQESIEQWLRSGWKSADLLAAGYSEGKAEKFRTYEVPDGYVMKCVMRQVGDKIIFNVVTRQSIGKEQEIHERFPVVTKKRF